MNKSPFKTNSQCLQDFFVFQLFQGRKGFFLDLGAGNGGQKHIEHSFMSNTYALEMEANWDGICIDFDNDWCKKAAPARKAKIVYADLMKEKINEVLDNLDCPLIVDYLSLDVDDATEKVLDELDFNKRKFKVITFEHNLFQALSTSDQEHSLEHKQEVLRFYDKSRKLFKSNGYTIVVGNVIQDGFGPFEDWYFESSFLNCSVKEITTSSEYVKSNELLNWLGVKSAF